MKGADIANRLKEVLPKYTNDFDDTFTITSLTRSATTATATATAHGLASGNYVTIKGALDPVSITSLNRTGKVVTVVTTTPHNLVFYTSTPKLVVEISGASPSDYNGIKTLLSVVDKNTFTYQIATTPTTPATTPGFLLQEDFNGYNGYKQVTVTDANTFTYTVSSSLNTPAQGTIQMGSATRIAWAATIARADQFYTADKNRMLQNWMFIVLDSTLVSKDGTTASDIDSTLETNQEYYFQSQQNFSILTYVPTSDGSTSDTLAGNASDTARDYEQPILKSIANFQFSSNLSETCYQPSSYIGSEENDFNGAYYVHRFDFTAKIFIKEDDTIDHDPGVPLELVVGTTKNKDVTYKPKFR